MELPVLLTSGKLSLRFLASFRVLQLFLRAILLVLSWVWILILPPLDDYNTLPLNHTVTSWGFSSHPFARIAKQWIAQETLLHLEGAERPLCKQSLFCHPSWPSWHTPEGYIIETRKLKVNSEENLSVLVSRLSERNNFYPSHRDVNPSIATITFTCPFSNESQPFLDCKGP